MAATRCRLRSACMLSTIVPILSTAVDNVDCETLVVFVYGLFNDDDNNVSDFIASNDRISE
jgi:hypothetical protein